MTTPTDTTPLHAVSAETLAEFRAGLPADQAARLDHTGFSGGLGQGVAISDAAGAIAFALIGIGQAAERARSRFHLAAGLRHLPERTYDWANPEALPQPEAEVLGCLLEAYRFDRYHPQAPMRAALMPPADLDAGEIAALADGERLTRDLINTPASDMGPVALHKAVAELGAAHGAVVNAIIGDDLLTQNFPMIHAVGRASAEAPRLIELTWGRAGPAVTLVGKGVCFDTGGLNIKPGSSMGLMKKDMGGAATVLGLAAMIMAQKLPVRLRVLIPAVENAIAGNAFRPQDILTARNGLTVEINNTDAEGRLVLADALALAAEDTPDLLVSMATLTGAARVAVGPDLAPFYTDDEGLAGKLHDGAAIWADPVWRMPFWDPYEAMIEPGIADLDNAPGGGFAGSITAALFLRRFAGGIPSYMHFDIYGWRPKAEPGRPKGGIGQGARALYHVIGNLSAG